MATAEGAEGVETEKTPAEQLFEAARDGDVAALDALLPDATAAQLHEEHMHENEFGQRGTVTPLFVAAWFGHEAIVRRLISAGAEVERGCIGGAPLMAAVAKSRTGCVVALLEAGADVNQEVIRDDRFKFRVLHVAVHGWASPEVIRLLVSRGAGVDAVSRDARGESTPLSLAFNRRHPPDVTDADTRKRYFLNRHSVAFMLLRAGADVSHLFQERLHLATEERPHPCEATRPLVNRLATDRHRTYVEAVHAAGGFAAYARARQCQLLTIKLLARGHGCMNLPEALIPTIVSFWDKPWVPSFNSDSYPV
jgi:hypothetical protein